MTDPTQTIPAPDIVRRLEATSTLIKTPCGNGVMMWRRWGQGPVVILAHGASGSWLHWIRNIESLAQHYTVYAMDLPGMGDSAMPEREDHASIASTIEAGLKQIFGDPQPLNFVGFSFGGVTCGHFAVKHPQWVRRLIVIDTGGLGTPRGEMDLKLMRGLTPEQRIAANRNNLLQLMLHHEESADELAMYIQTTCGPKGKIMPRPLVFPDQLRTQLPSIRAQVDAIWGELDRPHPNPTVQEAAIREFHPRMDFRVIPEAGHWVMFERPDAFNRAMLDLLGAPLRQPA